MIGVILDAMSAVKKLTKLKPAITYRILEEEDSIFMCNTFLYDN